MNHENHELFGHKHPAAKSGKTFYVTYDIERKVSDHRLISQPKIKAVTISGTLKEYKIGEMTKQSGRQVRGICITYEKKRKSHHRQGFKAKRKGTVYKVASSKIPRTVQEISVIIEVPPKATNLHFYAGKKDIPSKYKCLLK